MSETMHPVSPGLGGGGTTDDDRRTAMRFVVGRPGWRVEARATAGGEAFLALATPSPDGGGQRLWRVARTAKGLVVGDEASGRRLCAPPTMREALVSIWEAATGDAPD